MNQTDAKSIKEIGKEFFWSLLDFLKYMVATGVIAFLVTRLLFPVAFVPTSSMENTIPSESFVICSKVSYFGEAEPQRGDVILFHRSAETQDEKMYTKRVVGLSGDIVEIKGGVTYINGTEYKEGWLKETPDTMDFGPYEVPAGKYFCMGDNRNNSYDCRYWEEHFIDASGVVAKCQIVLSPKKVGLIDDQH